MFKKTRTYSYNQTHITPIGNSCLPLHHSKQETCPCLTSENSKRKTSIAIKKDDWQKQIKLQNTSTFGKEFSSVYSLQEKMILPENG